MAITEKQISTARAMNIIKTQKIKSSEFCVAPSSLKNIDSFLHHFLVNGL